MREPTSKTTPTAQPSIFTVSVVVLWIAIFTFSLLSREDLFLSATTDLSREPI